MFHRSMRQTLATISRTKRNFSAEVALYAPVATEDHDQISSLMSFSNKHLAQQAQQVSDEADYLKKLNKINTEKGVYQPLEVNDADNKHLNQIKKKVNSIVAQELALLDYQDEQKQMALNDQTYQEVVSK